MKKIITMLVIAFALCGTGTLAAEPAYFSAENPATKLVSIQGENPEASNNALLSEPGDSPKSLTFSLVNFQEFVAAGLIVVFSILLYFLIWYVSQDKHQSVKMHSHSLLARDRGQVRP